MLQYKHSRITIYREGEDLTMTIIDGRRYGKPSMTNLPSDLGKAIFRHILSTPVPNRAEMNAESERLVNEMLRARGKGTSSRKSYAGASE